MVDRMCIQCQVGITPTKFNVLCLECMDQVQLEFERSTRNREPGENADGN